MTLKLYYHPLSSYCHKVLIALYENEVAFEAIQVDLGDPAQRASLQRVWPFTKFPVLQDDARDLTVPESSIIIEYLDQFYPGETRLLPSAPVLALKTREHDRFYDLYVHEPMQKIVGDRLRPEGSKDPHGVQQARATLDIAYGIIERELAGRSWSTGDAFSMADCAAAPALYFAHRVHTFDAFPNVVAYMARLLLRPSYARVLRVAAPYFHNFPG